MLAFDFPHSPTEKKIKINRKKMPGSGLFFTCEHLNSEHVASEDIFAEST